MSSAARKVLEQALALPEREREELVKALRDNLSPDAVAHSPEWTSEVGRRIAEIERGEVELIEWSELERLLETPLERGAAGALDESLSEVRKRRVNRRRGGSPVR